MDDRELPGTVLRLPMVYGPGDPLHRLFPILKRIDDGRPALLLDERMAQWRATRGFVENVAAGFIDPYVGGGTKDFAPYVLMILALMVRPYGIFGKPIIERI